MHLIHSTAHPIRPAFPLRRITLDPAARAEALFAVTQAHRAHPGRVLLGWAALKSAQGHPIRQTRVARPNLIRVA